MKKIIGAIGGCIAVYYVIDVLAVLSMACSWLDLVKYGSLTFEAPDLEAFPSLAIAMECGKAGGTLPCAFNAANEEAVNAFLEGKIKYLDIPYITQSVTQAHQNVLAPTIEDIEAADAVARRAAQAVIRSL